jgi:hypothetical protein
LSAESAVGNRRAVARYELAIEPGRALAADLLVEAKRGQRPHSEPIATLPQVVGLSTLDDVLGDPPMVGIDPLDVAAPAQCLQPADVRADES